MNPSGILQLRLKNQQILDSRIEDPKELVSLLGAVQSQDYYGAIWGLGLRLKNSSSEKIEKLFNSGEILRTHALRPTWHFVTPKDIRWIMELNAPQVKRIMGYYNRKLDLDEKLFEKTGNILRQTLKGKTLTRRELQSILKENGIEGTGQRIGHIIMWAELDNIICSGPRKGKQFTYALLDDKAPKTKSISRDDALSRLAEIFFKTRGPATLKDFSKWSGLSLTDSKKGLDSVKSKFESGIIDGKECFFESSAAGNPEPNVLLLPNYDEYVSSYHDYSIISFPETRANLKLIGNAAFWNHMVSNGKIIGSWKRTFKPKVIEITLAPQLKLTKDEIKLFEKEAKRFGDFYNLPVTLL